MKNTLQTVIDQIGIEGLQKSMPSLKVGTCDVHGSYGYQETPNCPLCPNPNGTTATEVEHYLDIKAAIDPTDGNNPGVKANPYGV